MLVVEDDPDLAALLRRWLEAKKHRVDHIGDGQAALAALRADPLPDLVLLDVMLPKVDGFEVLRRLRAEARTKSLPVVMVSNFSRDRDASRGRELGANDYIVKPLMESDFLKRLQPLLRDR